MFNSGYKGIRAVDGSGIVTLKDVEVQQTSLQPKITSWSYTNGSYVPYPDTAIVGGETIVIYGSGFQNGANVYIGSTAITSTRLDQNRITFTAPSQSAGSYVLYVINPNGNAAVYAPGIYYNSYPVWNTTTYANTFIAPTSSVSFNLNATDSANLTFTLQSGSLPTGLTLYPSGLISGTTTVANTTVYTFTAVATDSFNQAAQASIIYTITYIISDPYFNQTTLLLNGETNTNTYIQDISTNNFAITPVGAATPNRFNPLWGNGYYGNYFDGSTGGIDTPVNQTALQLGSNNFTIEAWINLSTTPSNFIIIFGCESLTYDGILFGISTSNTIQINISSNGSTYNLFNSSTFATVIKTNTWTHVALVRNNGTLYAYINGVQDSTTYNISTNSIYFNSASVGAIGIRPPTQSLYFPGYISNLRVVNGTAVYTSNFTPSTTPLTAIANTALLTCQSANFVDNSTNAFTLTSNGTIKVVSNQPFAIVPSTATITTNNAGYYSGYFDGSSGYLTAPLTFSYASNFTIECWFNTNTTTTNACLYSDENGIVGGTLLLNYPNNGQITFYGGTVSNFASTSTGLNNGVWHHVALTRSSTNLYLFIDGVLQNTTTVSGTFATSAGLTRIGNSYYSSRYFGGYISNFRMVSGTAVYTSNFTPSTTPLTAIANTALLTCQNSTYVDNSTNSFALTPTGKTQPSAYQPFASPTTSNTAITPSVYGSSLFDGSTGYLTVPGNAAFNFGTGDYTIEAWVFPTSNNTNMTIFGGGVATTPVFNISALTSISINPYGTAPVNGTQGCTQPYVFTTYTWYHVAITRQSSITRIFVNGGQIGLNVTDTTSYVQGSMAIGATQAGTQFFPGYISNMRVVKGTAVYTSNFIPPTIPLTAIANTSLLTLQNKNGANNNTFYDDGQYNYSVGTIAGNPAQGTFTPFSQTGWSIAYPALAYMTYAANPIGTFGAGATFTVEAWVNMSTYSATNYFFTLLSSCDQSTALYWAIGIGSTGLATLYWYDGNTNSCTGSTVLAKGTWYHVAVNVTAGVVKIYINGATETLTGTTTLTNPTGNSTYTTGCERGSSNGGSSGYISNLRTNTGALYPSAFTPSTTPLTNVANTTLLTAQSNRFVDNSSSARAITPFATTPPSVQAFSPFAPGVSYSSANNGGSIYFNGSSKIGLPVSRNWYFGQYSGTFTVECWLYQTASPGSGNNCRLLQTGPNGVSTSLVVLSISPTNTVGIGLPYSATGCTTSSTFNNNCWNHIAICSNAWTVSIYINGVLAGGPTAITAQGLYAGNNDFEIGYDTAGTVNAAYTGYMSGLRITANQVVYSGAFTPPTAPPTPTANTLVLLSGTNTGVQDATGKNDIITYGSVKTQANTVKYGTGAMYFDGAGNYLLNPAPANPLLCSFNGSFTIEMWVYLTSTGNQYPIFSGYGSSNSQGGIQMSISSGLATGSIYVSSTAYNATNSTSIAQTTWTHLALVRNGTTLTLYVNGVGGTGVSASGATNYSSSFNLYVGQNFSTSYPFTGYIDDLRITNGIARYTSNFTPPTITDFTL